MTRPHLLLAALVALVLMPFSASAWIRSPANTFATLPAGATPAEGITADAAGNIYVTTFGFPPKGESSLAGQLIVFNQSGKVIRQVTIIGASPHLLGLGFNPTTSDLLVLDFGAAKVLKVNPVSGTSSVFSNIGNGAGLNALTFDTSGNVYISDSFNGIIWRTGAAGGPATPWLTDPLLKTTGLPPFGANGIAFSRAGDAMLIANTGDDAVIRVPVAGGVAGQPMVLAYSINGADGVMVDEDDNIWVVANQSDEVVVLDKNGKVIAKLGDFDGLDPHGAVKGLLFPASIVASGEFVYLTNLVLDTRLFGFPTVDSQWAAQVTSFTVSRIQRHLPPVQGPGDH
ncbi:MAG TPA: SMP-30/gluconolactonase/LRE family protein [Casimicrobiaceae bacterium]